MSRITEVTGKIVMADGVEVEFRIGTDAGWAQWGETTSNLARTSPVTEAMAKAVIEFLPSDNDEDGRQDTWIDESDPHYLREIGQAHLDADADHKVVPESPTEDGVADNCVCGLAITSDGKRHGFDA